jgi:hypothetical protein
MWIEMFNDLPAVVEVWPGIEHPEVSENGIDGRVEDDLLEAYVAHIRERVAAKNMVYNTEVAPQLEEAAERQQAQLEAEEQRLAEVRRRLEGL